MYKLVHRIYSFINIAFKYEVEHQKTDKGSDNKNN